jgi:hypothetical protein
LFGIAQTNVETDPEAATYSEAAKFLKANPSGR